MMTHNVPHKDYRDSIYVCINSWYNFLYMYKQHIPCILCTLCCGGPFYAAWFIQSIACVLWAVFFGGWSHCSTCSFLSWWLAIVWPKGCWGSLFSLFSFASKMFLIFLLKSEKERFMHLRINFFLSVFRIKLHFVTFVKLFQWFREKNFSSIKFWVVVRSYWSLLAFAVFHSEDIQLKKAKGLDWFQ